ncbi:MAG: glycosyltransferase, partial [Actinobacteria bacterium]|nr:glycosyltransferase [Actinomycetota bacterium]
DHGIITGVGLPLKRRVFLKYQQVSQNLSYFRSAKRVVCVSEYLIRQLPEYIRKKATFIYNGIDHYAYSRINEDSVKRYRSQLGVADEDILLLYVGRLNLTNQPYKGLAELVSIYQQVNFANEKVKLLAVGYGSRNDSELLKNQGVLCLPNASEEEMPVIYSASDIYTTCSQWEGFDLPVGEAQYFKKPAICYSIGAHPEILENGKTGFIVKDRDEFAEKIKLLAADKKMRIQMGENAGEFIKKFYWQNSIEQYDAEIRKILKIATDIAIIEEKTVPEGTPPEQPAEQQLKQPTGQPPERQPERPPERSVESSEEKPVTKPEDMQIRTFEAESMTSIEAMEKGLKKKVSVIIVNYNASLPCMRECLDSLNNQSYKNMEIVIFDNASQNSTIDIMEKQYTGRIKIIRSDKNLGLGEAINQALKETDGEYIFISNFDVTYDKIAVEELVDSMSGLESRYIGLAPKIKLYYQREYIESVGTYIDNNFYLGYNGIGQLDLDQYNKPEDVFGLSFTSAFIKRDYLCPGTMSLTDKPIDPTFFLYYEDIDFCYRANLLGYSFKSCPSAICYHKYAFSFRDEATAFVTKYYYQKLNAMKLAYKNAESSNMKRVIKNELGIQRQNLKDKNLKAVAKKIIKDWRAGKNNLKKQRPYIQITRQVGDGEIIKYSWGEQNFFDIVSNEPVYCLQSLLLTYKRLFVITGSRKYEEYIGYLQALEDTRFKIEKQHLKNFLHGKLEYEPASIHNLIDRI